MTKCNRLRGVHKVRNQNSRSVSKQVNNFPTPVAWDLETANTKYYSRCTNSQSIQTYCPKLCKIQITYLLIYLYNWLQYSTYTMEICRHSALLHGLCSFGLNMGTSLPVCPAQVGQQLMFGSTADTWWPLFWQLHPVMPQEHRIHAAKYLKQTCCNVQSNRFAEMCYSSPDLDSTLENIHFVRARGLKKCKVAIHLWRHSRGGSEAQMDACG